ncbi:MAG: hypothetical protein WD749_07100 [Phycisphaerales bacterium]
MKGRRRTPGTRSDRPPRPAPAAARRRRLAAPVLAMSIGEGEARWAMYAAVRLAPCAGGGSREVLVIMGDHRPARAEFLATEARHDPSTAPGDPPAD